MNSKVKTISVLFSITSLLGGAGRPLPVGLECESQFWPFLILNLICAVGQSDV